MPVKKKPAAKKAAPKRKVAAKKAAPKKKVAAKKAAPKKKVVAKKAAPKKKVAARKAAPKKKVAARKAAPKKNVAPKKKTARKPNAAFMRPVQPDDVLSAVVGAKPIPRTEVTKKLWAYIKKNDLQNPANRREIIADDKLKPLFGGKKKVNMFEMTKLVSTHMK